MPLKMVDLSACHASLDHRWLVGTWSAHDDVLSGKNLTWLVSFPSWRDIDPRALRALVTSSRMSMTRSCASGIGKVSLPRVSLIFMYDHLPTALHLKLIGYQ
jgi:hypothetical protein